MSGKRPPESPLKELPLPKKPKDTSENMEDAFKQLLEGQKRISEEIRCNEEKHRLHERQTDIAKANLFNVAQQLREVFNSQTDVIEAVDFNSEDIRDLKREVRENVDTIRKNEAEYNDLRLMINRINERLNAIEKRQLELCGDIKAKSVVINGLRENKEEDTRLITLNFLQAIDEHVTNNDFDSCYRVGSQEGTDATHPQSRSIIVTFYSLEKKKALMTAKNNLKSHPVYGKTYMNDDLPPETRQLREDIRQISKYAEEKGYTSRITGNKLIVDGTSYDSSELELLPNDILPERVKTRRRGNGIAFQGHTSCFSNFFPCRFTYDGVEYTSSVQAFHHRKALAVERDVNAHTIMQMSIAKKIKQYGDKMPTSTKWEAEKVNVLEDIVYHKFAQSPAIRNKLCDTMDLPLYEATTNQFWGCGLKMNARQWSTGIYPGRNIMGQILMRVRTRMQDSRARSNHAVPSSTVSTASLSHSPIRAAPLSAATDQLAADSVARPNTQIAPTGSDDIAKVGGKELLTSTPTAAQPVLSTVNEEPLDGNMSNDESSMDTEHFTSKLESSTCSSSSHIGDLTTNGELDSAKIRSWKLPRVKKFHNRTLFSTNRQVNRKDRAPYNVNERCKQKDPISAERSTQQSTPAKRGRQNRSFVNSSYKKDLTTMGYDTESQYIKSIEHYNQENVTSRKSNTNKR